MEFQGRIFKVLSQKVGTKSDGSEWRSQDFIFEYFESAEQRYADRVVLTVMNERIREYDLHEGEEVRIGFSHSCREYNGRWYNDVRIYKFEKVAKAAPAVVDSQIQPEQTGNIPF